MSVTPPVDMIIAGSSPILTCTVELSPLVDILVNVTTEWTGPGGTTFRPNKLVSAVMVNLTTYISTVTVDVARNGSYICEAAINSGGTMSGSTVITLGMCLISNIYISMFEELCSFFYSSPPPSSH